MTLRTLFLIGVCLAPALAVAQPRLTGPLPDPVSDEAFAAVARGFNDDPTVPSNPRSALTCARGRCTPSEDRGSHVRETVVIDGPDGSPVPAYLALPMGSPGPHPVVVLLHALNGSRDDFWATGTSLDSLREALHAAGFAVLALDTPYHGGRLYENDFNDPPHLVLSGQADRLRDMSTRSVIEHRRAIDYLVTRDDINAERIGALGFSQGAMHVLYLSAVDPRVSAAVVWATPMRKNDPPFYPGHFAQRAQAGAVLVIAGTDDPFYSVAEAETVFGLIPTDEKRLVLFDGGHQARLAEVPTAVEWLGEHVIQNRD
jgi:dienelactone hydrolase